MNFDTVAGIYVYCMDYHTGQNSRLYRLMCRCQIHLTDNAIKSIRYGRYDKYDTWLTARKIYRKLKRDKSQ